MSGEKLEWFYRPIVHSTWFKWEGYEYEWFHKDGEFPVVADFPGGPLREATTEDDILRIKMVEEGTWKRIYHIGDNSPNKWGPFEWTHAVWGLATQWLRRNKILNRGNRDWRKPDGYIFPGTD